MPGLNKTLADMGVYASKAISALAKETPGILNLSIGEPEFGPPAHLLDAIRIGDLTLDHFLDSVKRYEQSLGSPMLRRQIAAWYARRYGLKVDPETQVLVTHGGVEAIALAILCCTAPGQAVAVTDPSYMLYERAILTLGRRPTAFQRPLADEEYAALAQCDEMFVKTLGGAKAIVVNSPENPTGYMLSANEWSVLGEIVARNNAWLIHDEVYDAMAFGRPHIPARAVHELGSRAILVNSFSKKFGMPGLRIGWIVADEDVIRIASKAHDYLYLGVNILYERIATRLLDDPAVDDWMNGNTAVLQARARKAIAMLTPAMGFTWRRQPAGGMFLFPDVRRYYDSLPPTSRADNRPVGDVVAHDLVTRWRVATVPGSVYGRQGQDCVRLVLCCAESEFDAALQRLTRSEALAAE